MQQPQNRRIIYLATQSRPKQRELAAMMEEMIPGRFEVRTAGDIDPNLDWDETASSFAGNAAIKAHAVKAALEVRGLPPADILGDDSGLSVAALGGAPGIFSSRYGGPGSDDRRNRIHLVQELAKLLAVDPALAAHVVDAPNRALPAHFTCSLCWLDPQGVERRYEGRCEGGIILAPRGGHGFGYDSMFVTKDSDRTMAELDETAKNFISHRRRAITQWVEALEADL